MTAPSLGSRWRAVAVPMALLRLGGQAAEFVGWAILARRLGTSAFGDVAIAFLLARYAGLVADWGASFRGARDVAAKGRHGSVHAYVRKRSLIAAGLGLGAALLAVAIGYAELAPFAVVVISIGMSRDWIAIGRERGVRAGIPLAVQGTVLALLSLLVRTPGGAALVVAAGYGLSVIVSILLNPLEPELGDDEEMSSNTYGWILAAVLANQVTSSTDTVLLGLLKSSADAGIYAAVYRIPNAWLAILTLMLGSLLPMATTSRHDDIEGHHRLRARSLKVSAIGAGLVLLVTPISWFLVPVLFGPAYLSGRAPLVILMIATAVITLAAPLHPFAISSGRDRSYALILVLGAAGNVCANLLIIPVLGMVGAALTTLCAQTVIGVLLWRLAHQATAPSPGSSAAEPSG